MSGEPRMTPIILIVDDHESTRSLLARLLTEDGYQTEAVAGPAEALAFLKTTKPALVITDFSMPEMDGLTLLAEMRKDPHLGDVPVIMFSALGGKWREVALRAGVNAYIVKGSMDFATLQHEIRRLAGPGMLEKRLPDVPAARAKDAG